MTGYSIIAIGFNLIVFGLVTGALVFNVGKYFEIAWVISGGQYLMMACGAVLGVLALSGIIKGVLGPKVNIKRISTPAELEAWQQERLKSQAGKDSSSKSNSESESSK